MPQDEDIRHAPATLRNRAPILDVLTPLLPDSGPILEVASGSGEHIVHFARHFPGLIWQPSDPSADARRSIAAWTAAEGLDNIRPPLDLDAASDTWPINHADALLCINMIHISPWPATVGLMRGAGRILDQGAPLYLYGPFRRTGHSLEPSNEAFDLDLRRRDPSWGLREVDAVTACAADHGLRFETIVEMPANNLSVIFRKE
jgi:hypothetical protein